MKDSTLCAAHGGAGRRPGAPKGNQNRRRHGYHSKPTKPFESIDDVVSDMMLRQAQLSAFIEGRLQGEDEEGEIDLTETGRLMMLLGQNASRIGRLLRDKRALTGQSADGLLEALGAVLDELSTELGVKL